MSTDRDRPDVARGLTALLAVFHRLDENGARVYSDDDLRAFIPVLWLADDQAGPPSPELTRVLQRFAADVGLREGMSPAEAQEKLAAHYAAHPLHPQLQREVEAVARDIVRSLVDGSAGAHIAKKLGVTTSSVPVGQGPAPAGSVKASPFARFAPVPPKKP